MALETGTYIADLTITNPTAADPKSQGDDHLRLLKTALRNTFPGFTGAVIVAGTNGGAADVYTLTPTTALAAYVSPLVVIFSPNATNTGAVTLNVSGLGAKALKSVAGAALVAGELVVSLWYAAVYDGTEFHLTAVTKPYVDQLAFAAALPLQTGNGGKYVTTNGVTASWVTIAATDLSDYATRILGVQVALAVAL